MRDGGLGVLWLEGPSTWRRLRLPALRMTVGFRRGWECFWLEGPSTTAPSGAGR